MIRGPRAGLFVGSGGLRRSYEPDGAPEPEDGPGEPFPAGGVPWREPDPMLGQFRVEAELPEPELELEPEPEPELELLPELEPVEPELPVPELLLDEGVDVEELELEPGVVLGVELEVVAALATNAPPATRPVVNAPMASTLRKRMCMERCLSSR
jgi:hypothetical protein